MPKTLSDNIVAKTLRLYSEGTRLAAEIRLPDRAPEKAGHPAVLLCHGWGGLKSHLARYAQKFAQAGFAALTFDYRGWGESDGRIIAATDAPPLLEAGVRTLPVRVLSEIVDPIDQTTDIKNCLAALTTEPDVDPKRIGIWGTSYGGGHAVFTAGTDDRVRAVVAQVGGYGFPAQYRDFARGRAAEKARGKLDPVVPQNGLDAVPGLQGTPDVARMVEHFPLRAAESVRVPTLILDAEFDEFNPHWEHGYKAYEIIHPHAPAEYRTFPCKHFDVYDKYFEESTDLALAWFGKHL